MADEKESGWDGHQNSAWIYRIQISIPEVHKMSSLPLPPWAKAINKVLLEHIYTQSFRGLNERSAPLSLYSGMDEEL